ncbi:MAG: peptidase S9, partial [Muribaculaceae bacterium]|nr:peptidase S9 [Muribaculaceae bacterium]
MNKFLTTMSVLLLPAMISSCSQNGDNDDVIIEKPTVEIVDGQLTPEVLEAMGRIGQVCPSPDGSLIAFTLTYESIELNKGNSEIYTMKPDGSDLRRITKTASSESDLAWYDNGNRLAFIGTADGGGRQVYSVDSDGSELVQMSSLENGVECFKISPDEKKIVLASPIRSWIKDSTIYAGLDKTTGRLVDDLMYKHWDEWVTEIPHPFVADFNGKSVENAKDIMEG